jgi:hypothetical protein
LPQEEIEVPESGANGFIVSLGAGIGGWSLYAKDGKLKHCYNFFGIENYFAEGKQAIPAGKHQVRMEFTYDGGGLAKGGSVSLYVAGQKDGEGRVDMTVPMLFGIDTCSDSLVAVAWRARSRRRHFVPQGNTLCRRATLCAAGQHFVPQGNTLCRRATLCAAGQHFVP